MRTIEVAHHGALVLWRLSKERGNAIDEPLVEELLEACVSAAEDETVRGALLCSAHDALFSPGLDLVTLSRYDRPAMERFFGKFSALFDALYAFPKPLVAALSGHAVAGGCLLSLCADFRVLRRGGVQVGLNDNRIGVPLPRPMTVLLRASVPPQHLTRVALLCHNFTDEDAVRVGLCDELAEDGDFEQRCLERLEELVSRVPLSLSQTKRYLRGPTLAEMRARRESDIAEFLDGWFAPEAQERIQRTAAALGASAAD